MSQDALNPPHSQPLLIGWKEFLDFPEWRVRRVKVKIDTGARTSALGALRYQVEDEPGKGLSLRMWLALYRKRPERVLEVRVPVLRMITVKNSGGLPEERPLIEGLIRLGPVQKRIPITVANRATMLFPMILGREALRGDFIVDVSRKYLLGKGSGARGQGSDQ